MLLYYIFIFIFGTIIGSFLNVVILRHNTGDSIVKTRSRCFNCGKNLEWYELIPILSFFIQGGKCRKCKSKISWQYPIMEFLTGLIFLLVFQITHYSLFITIYYFIIFSLLIVISVYDIRHQIIPNKFVYLFDVLALLPLLITNYSLLITHYDHNFLAGLIFSAFFGFLWLISKGKWMGLGDAKLFLGVGWLLGLVNGLIALVLSFWLGSIFGISLMLIRKKEYNMKSKIPFGPFIVLGTTIAFFFGGQIISLIMQTNLWVL